MSRQRATQWRQQHGFEDDRGFAYAFESRANATTEEWASVRAGDQQSLFGDVAQAVEQRAPNRHARWWRSSRAEEGPSGEQLEVQVHMADRGRDFTPTM